MSHREGGDTGPGLGKRQNWLPGMEWNPQLVFNTQNHLRWQKFADLCAPWVTGQMVNSGCQAGLAVLKRATGSQCLPPEASTSLSNQRIKVLGRAKGAVEAGVSNTR